MRRLVPALVLAAITVLGSPVAPIAQEPTFPEEFMTDMTVIREGRDLFQRQCGHCHGSRAYPGKAPALRPDRYEPDFVFWVVQGGYGKMPSMGEVFDEEQTRKVVAWVKSSYFSQ